MTSRIGKASLDIIGMFIPFCDTVSRANASSVNRAFRDAFNNLEKLWSALTARGCTTPEKTAEGLKKWLILSETSPYRIAPDQISKLTGPHEYKAFEIPQLDVPNALSTTDFIKKVEQTITDLRKSISVYEQSEPNAKEIFREAMFDLASPFYNRYEVDFHRTFYLKHFPQKYKYAKEVNQLEFLLGINQPYQSLLKLLKSKSLKDLIEIVHGKKSTTKEKAIDQPDEKEEKPKKDGAIKSDRSLGHADKPKIEAPRPKVDAKESAKGDLQNKIIEDFFRDGPLKKRRSVQRAVKAKAPKAETPIRFFRMPQTIWGKLGLAGVVLPVFAYGFAELNIAKIFSTAVLGATALYAFNRLENPSGRSFIRTLASDAFYMMTCRCERPSRS